MVVFCNLLFLAKEWYFDFIELFLKVFLATFCFFEFFLLLPDLFLLLNASELLNVFVPYKISDQF